MRRSAERPEKEGEKMKIQKNRKKTAVRVCASVLAVCAAGMLGAGTPHSAYAAEKTEVNLTDMYSYDAMSADIQKLAAEYPDSFRAEQAGTTALGRSIWKITLGNPDAEKKIMVQATVHAREYICSQTVTAMCAYYAAHPEKLHGVGFTVFPMANPDGVSIAQYGASSVPEGATRNFVAGAGNTSAWKANAMGVDINRNFGAGWQAIDQGVHAPAPENYKGAAPDSEPETKALEAELRTGKYSAAVAYHMQGSIIYYDEPGNTAGVSRASSSLASAIASVNGYKKKNLKASVSKSGHVVQGGFTDWAQLSCGVPAVTVEIGTSLPPAAQKSSPHLYALNRDTWEAAALLYSGK